MENIIGGWRRDFLFNLARASWEIAEYFKMGQNFPLNEENVFPYLFYFFPKTFSSCYFVLSSMRDRISYIMEKDEVLFLELSAGTCSGSAAFLYLIREILSGKNRRKKRRSKIRIFLQDISEISLDIGLRVLRNFDLKDVEINKLVSDATRIKIKRDVGAEPDIVLCSFSLYDMFRDEVEDMIVWCDRIIRSLRSGGLFFLVEPALKRRNSLFLMKIRDALRKFVVAPCPHKLDCPILKRGDDWCHFGVKWIPPDYLSRGMYLIGGRPPDLNFSYLVFQAEGDSAKGSDMNEEDDSHFGGFARVVSHRLEEKGRVRFWTCERGEKKLYHFLKKHKTDLNSEVQDIHSGDLVKIEGAEDMGEYLSILPQTSVRIMKKLFDIDIS